MDKEPNSREHREYPSTNQVLLNISLKTLYWAAGAIIGLCGMVIRFWGGSIDEQFRAIRTTAAAEETARIQNDTRTAATEFGLAQVREQHTRYDRDLETLFRKVERLEERSQWNNQKR